jgi:hypothetical protein
MSTKAKTVILPLTVLLVALFLLSAALNLGVKIPLGFTELSFTSPSASIAGFEVAIGLVLLTAVVISNLYFYAGTYLFALIGIAEGLLSSDVQGLARNIHEFMVPVAFGGVILLIFEARIAYKSRKYETPSEKTRTIVTVLQFFVGGLVTLGGVAFTLGGTYPVGTFLGLVHLAVGLGGLFGGYFFLKRKTWSRKFLVWINCVTIAYSAYAESLAEIFAFLPQGINDALIGTIIAIIVSAAIIYLLLSTRPSLLNSIRINL